MLKAPLLQILFAVSVAAFVPGGAVAQTSAQAGLLNQALVAGGQSDWDKATSIVKRAHHPVASDIILWSRLRDGDGVWNDYLSFLNRNLDWPGLATLRKAGEREIPPHLGPEAVMAYFGDRHPQTGSGSLRLANALMKSGKPDKARAEIVRGWRKLSLSPPERKTILSEWGEALRPHHIERLDMLLWRGHTREAEVMLSLVDADWQKLARARIAIRRDTQGMQLLLRGVPGYLKDNPGLAFERYLYRTEKGQWDEAETWMLEHSATRNQLGRPDMWMQRRANLARQALRRGDTDVAYRIAAGNFGSEGWAYADSEWVAGFVALTHLNKPKQAAQHFETFLKAVKMPISLGRGHYWLGLAHEKAGNSEKAMQAWRNGARYQTSFYGQLAAERAGVAADNSISGSPENPDWRQERFVNSSVAVAARFFSLAGYDSRAAQFLRHMADDAPAETRAKLAQMAIDSGLTHIGIRIAKDATRAGIVIPNQYYPLNPITKVSWPVPTELAIAVARQESELNPGAVSHAGAQGLMQLMPATASEVSGSISVPYNKGRLTRDQMYNARLGTEYLSRLLQRYDGFEVLAIAAYNAGPGRVNEWIATFGDPRKNDVDTVVWMEMIPFSETRNYVQRVIEGMNVYKARLGDQTASISYSSAVTRQDPASEAVPRARQIGLSSRSAPRKRPMPRRIPQTTGAGG